MKRLALLVLFLLLPAYAGAAYTIYLKNGAEITDVKSYSESGDDVYIYFRSSSTEIPSNLKMVMTRSRCNALQKS